MERLEAYPGVDARDPAITLLAQGQVQPDKSWYDQKLDKITMSLMTKGFWITPRQYLRAEKDLKEQILKLPGGIRNLNLGLKNRRATDVQLWDLTEELMERHQWLKRERTPDNPTKIPMLWKLDVFARWARQLAERMWEEENGEISLTSHPKRSLDLAAAAEDPRDARKQKTWEHARYPFYACSLKICDIRNPEQEAKSRKWMMVGINHLVTAWDEVDAVLETISLKKLKKTLSKLKMDDNTDQLQWTQAFHHKSITTVIDSDEKLITAIESSKFPQCFPYPQIHYHRPALTLFSFLLLNDKLTSKSAIP